MFAKKKSPPTDDGSSMHAHQQKNTPQHTAQHALCFRLVHLIIYICNFMSVNRELYIYKNSIVIIFVKKLYPIQTVLFCFVFLLLLVVAESVCCVMCSTTTFIISNYYYLLLYCKMIIHASIENAMQNIFNKKCYYYYYIIYL